MQQAAAVASAQGQVQAPTEKEQISHQRPRKRILNRDVIRMQQAAAAANAQGQVQAPIEKEQTSHPHRIHKEGQSLHGEVRMDYQLEMAGATILRCRDRVLRWVTSQATLPYRIKTMGLITPHASDAKDTAASSEEHALTRALGCPRRGSGVHEPATHGARRCTMAATRTWGL